MGKASSAKKVARAARAGGKNTGQRRNIGFPAAIVAIVVLGVGLIAFARQDPAGDGKPALSDHWHASYGVYVCDRWVQNLADVGEDALGIHTHEDGLVHIHPFLAGATGAKANLGKFFDQTTLKVTDSSITLPEGDVFGGRTYKNGKTTCGGKEARVVMGHWDDAANASGRPDDVRTSGIAGTRFDEDLGAYTIAFLPEDESIPVPPSAADIESLGSADGGGNQPVTGQPDVSERPDEGDGSTTTAPAGGELPPEGPAATEPPAGSGSSDTTAPAGGTETTAPEEGSATTAAETTAPAGG